MDAGEIVVGAVWAIFVVAVVAALVGCVVDAEARIVVCDLAKLVSGCET